MPELPEVETIRIGLQKKIIGLTIKDIEVLSPRSFKSVSSQASLIGDSKNLQGKKVLNIRRFSKLLVVDLSSSISLTIHLKMTGQLIYDDGKRFIGGHPTPDMKMEMPNSSTRIIVNFSDKSKLYFNDQRRFGYIKVIETKKVEQEKYVESLGPEPLEKGFTWEVLKTNLLRHKSMPIKVALMDQTIVSGVGNIYANEACFNAKLDPRIKVGDLDDKGFQKLHKGVIRVIKNGIKYGGSSKAHFVDPDGHKGYFLDYAYVYFRDKHPCKICKTEIKKLQLGGRGTYLCPSCQKSA